MMKKGTSKKSGLRATNDIVIIEEDPIGLEIDDRSGLTKDVVEAIKSSKLYIPETTEYYANKFPFTGKVVSKGHLCKIENIQIGTHVMFPRMGGMRWQKDGKQMINIKEEDIHAIILE